MRALLGLVQVWLLVTGGASAVLGLVIALQAAVGRRRRAAARRRHARRPSAQEGRALPH